MFFFFSLSRTHRTRTMIYADRKYNINERAGSIIKRKKQYERRGRSSRYPVTAVVFDIKNNMLILVNCLPVTQWYLLLLRCLYTRAFFVNYPRYITAGTTHLLHGVVVPKLIRNVRRTVASVTSYFITRRVWLIHPKNDVIKILSFRCAHSCI